MKRILGGMGLAAALALFAGSAWSGEAAPPADAAAAAKDRAREEAEPVPKTAKEKVSYGVGLSIGSTLARQGMEVDARILLLGILDALAGKAPRVPVAELQAAMQEVQEEMMRGKADQGQKNKAAGEAFLAENAKKDGVKTTASGLQYLVLKEGAGAQPKETDKVKVHYHGTLLDGTVFDSSVERQEPGTF